MKTKNCNKCLYCNRELKGITACYCINDKENIKLWNKNPRKKDRIKLVDRDV